MDIRLFFNAPDGAGCWTKQMACNSVIKNQGC